MRRSLKQFATAATNTQLNHVTVKKNCQKNCNKWSKFDKVCGR